MRHVLIVAALGLAACSGPAPIEEFVQDARAGKVDANALGLESFDAYSVGDTDVIRGSYLTGEGTTVSLSYETDEGVTLTESWENGKNAYTDTNLDCKVDKAALADEGSIAPKVVLFGNQRPASKNDQSVGQIHFNALLYGFGVSCPV